MTYLRLFNLGMATGAVAFSPTWVDVAIALGIVAAVHGALELGAWVQRDPRSTGDVA